MSPSPDENRRRWLRDLAACQQWHREKALETKSPIIGAERSDENILHNVFHAAVLDALILIENLPILEDEVEVVVDKTEGRAKNITNEVKEEDEDTSDS